MDEKRLGNKYAKLKMGALFCGSLGVLSAVLFVISLWTAAPQYFQFAFLVGCVLAISSALILTLLLLQRFVLVLNRAASVVQHMVDMSNPEHKFEMDDPLTPSVWKTEVLFSNLEILTARFQLGLAVGSSHQTLYDAAQSMCDGLAFTMQRQLALEKIVTTISSRLISLAPDEIDTGIINALKIAGDFFGAEYNYLFSMGDDWQLHLTHEWLPVVSALRLNPLPDLSWRDLPWFSACLERLELVLVPRVQDLPPAADTERQFWLAQGIQSLVAVPLVSGNALFGLLVFDSTRVAEPWSAEMIRLLRLLGEMIVNVLVRTQTEVVLRSSEAELRALLAAMTDLILVFDAQGEYLEVVTTAPELLYRPAEQLLGKKLHEILPTEDAERFLMAIQRCLETHAPVSLEYALPLNGHQSWFDARISPMLDDSVIFVARDITERKRTEAALQRRNQESRELSNLVAAMTSTLSLDQVLQRIIDAVSRIYPQQLDVTIQLLNESTEYLFMRSSSNFSDEQVLVSRFTPGEGLVGVALQNQVPVNVPDVLEDSRWLLAAHTTVYRSVLVFPLVSHEQVLGALSLYARKVAAFDDDDVRRLQDVARYAAIAVQNARLYEQAQQEILERLQAEQALQLYTGRLKALSDIDRAILAARSPEMITRAALGRLRNLIPCQRGLLIEFSDTGRPRVLASEKQASFAAFPQALLSLDTLALGKIQHVNDLAVLAHLSLLQESLFNQSVRSYLTVPVIFHNELLGALHLDALEADAFTPEHIDVALEIAASLAVAMRQAQLYDAVQQRADQLATATRQAQEARAAAETANQAKSAFLANMSHELRTPLNAILGFVQLLSADSDLTPAQQENLVIVRRSGEHLLALINDVLELSKIEAGRISVEVQDFDLYRLLEDLKQMFRLRAEAKGLQMKLKYAKSVPRWVRMDQRKLRQVLINLLSNAVKFTQSDAVTLRVSLANMTSMISSQISLRFEVLDSGPGISPEDMEAVFAAFVQTPSGRQAKEGSGLGLPISQQLVGLMGGELKVQSAVGQGSTFSFDVPAGRVNKKAARAKLRADSPRRVVGIEPDQPTYRVLVVEDQEENRILLLRFLEPLGFELRAAADGQEALDIWQQWEPHLIWMDMHMPVLDGHEATRRIKATPQGQSTIIIALTARVLTREREQILADGCDGFVRKPFAAEDLFGALTQYLGVRFVYESDTLESEDFEETSPASVPSAALSMMSASWVMQLKQATIDADLDLILTLIAKIREQDVALAEVLSSLAYDFDHDAILELIAAYETTGH